MPDHKAITDAELHQIKGASGATVGQVPTSDGAGAAPFASIPNTNKTITSVDMGVNTLAEVALGCEFVAMAAGDVSSIRTILTGDSYNANTTFTVEINGTAVTDGGFIQPTGGTAGRRTSATPTAAKTVAAGDRIKVSGTTGGGWQTATNRTCTVFFLIEES